MFSNTITVYVNPSVQYVYIYIYIYIYILYIYIYSVRRTRNVAIVEYKEPNPYYVKHVENCEGDFRAFSTEREVG